MSVTVTLTHPLSARTRIAISLLPKPQALAQRAAALMCAQLNTELMCPPSMFAAMFTIRIPSVNEAKCRSKLDDMGVGTPKPTKSIKSVVNISCL